MQNNERIEWQAQFETGVADIDDQHHVLIDTINEANAELCVETRPDVVNRLLEDLLAYAIYHFETEETLMRDFDYAGHDATMAQYHVAQHREFAETIVRARERFAATGELDRDALLAFLGHWLTAHILNVDQLLARYLARHGQCG